MLLRTRVKTRVRMPPLLWSLDRRCLIFADHPRPGNQSVTYGNLWKALVTLGNHPSPHGIQSTVPIVVALRPCWRNIAPDRKLWFYRGRRS
jgi:hypothetical protein